MLVKGTHLGATTDYNGHFRINQAPAGKQILVISYIGYASKEIPVAVNPGSATEVNAKLRISALLGEELVVTAQLLGQAAAINQQISSNTIVSVVSQERIRELPDQNAAESVGRLPGVAVQRDAGEGTKVVVRGLSPKFSSITVNGERIPSTDEEDRSVDLSMISSDALAGIEVFKSLTPDRDGDAIGGTINLVTRRAPKEPKRSIRIQSGYNDHEGISASSKGSFTLSNRMGKNKAFGALLTGNFQSANRASDNLDVGYTFVREAREGEDRAVIGVNNLNLVDRLETRIRFGAGANLDYKVGSGNISLNSFWSETRREEVRRRKRYRLGVARTEYDLRDRDINIQLFSNTLMGDHNVGRFEIGWRASFSRSTQNVPGSHVARFRELAGFRADVEENMGPDPIPLGAKNRIDATFFKDSVVDTLEVADRNLTAQFDVKLPFAFENGLNGFLNGMGGFGSGLRGTDQLKTTVESCLTFSISTLGRIRSNTAGKLSWNISNEEVASVVYVVAGTWVVLIYNADGIDVRLQIGLSTSQQNFGGRRFWLMCPIVQDGEACKNRVGKLHLPPGESYFGCRDCHDLTYRSSQDAHNLSKSLAKFLGLPLPDRA